MKVFHTEGSYPIKAWIDHVPEIEPSSMHQLEAVAKLPFIHKHVAVMPDVHWGNGTSVGSVIATKGAIIPAAVGVDLGCGVNAVLTNLTANHLPDSLGAVRSAIEAAIPHGRSHDGGHNDVGGWRGSVPEAVASVWTNTLYPEFKTICDKHPKIERCNNIEHLGSLGTGNHFVEVCLDEQDRVWVMLHSGSRGVGNRIGSHFIALAKEEMRRWYINVPDANLAYLAEGSQYFDDYVQAVSWAQDYALHNRRIMMDAALGAISSALSLPVAASEYAVNCHHNYVARERHFGEKVWITRKGAVQAREGALGVIPGAMGRASFIVRGKGNQQSFCSCSHGAGRVMSRGQAKKMISLDDHARETAGLECRKDEDVLDESPQAYKNVDDVMRSQSDLVDIVARLRSVVCVKG